MLLQRCTAKKSLRRVPWNILSCVPYIINIWIHLSSLSPHIDSFYSYSYGCFIAVLSTSELKLARSMHRHAMLTLTIRHHGIRPKCSSANTYSYDDVIRCEAMCLCVCVWKNNNILHVYSGNWTTCKRFFSWSFLLILFLCFILVASEHYANRQISTEI